MTTENKTAEQKRAYKQAWRDKNRNHINEYQRQWRERYKQAHNGVSYDVNYLKRKKLTAEQTSADDEQNIN